MPRLTFVPAGRSSASDATENGRLSVLVFLIAAIIIVPISGVQTQEGFRVSIVPESIAVSYNAPVADHHVFFVGEPVRVAIKLINHTRETFAPREERPLADQIVRIARARSAEAPRAGATPSSAPAVGWSRFEFPRHAHDGTSPIPARNYAEMRWNLTSAQDGGSLPPGLYDVSARYPLRPDHELSARVVVEVRQPQTRADQLDALMHAAIRTRWDGQFFEAERLLKQLLGLNPVSAAAYAELVAVYKGTRNCAAAQAALEQALGIIERGADRDSAEFSNQYGLEDWAAGLRGERQSCR